MGRPGRGLPMEEVDELNSLTHGSMLNTVIQLGSAYKIRIAWPLCKSKHIIVSIKFFRSTLILEEHTNISFD
jgi:hypothetical protein